MKIVKRIIAALAITLQLSSFAISVPYVFAAETCTDDKSELLTNAINLSIEYLDNNKMNVQCG